MAPCTGTESGSPGVPTTSLQPHREGETGSAQQFKMTQQQQPQQQEEQEQQHSMQQLKPEASMTSARAPLTQSHSRMSTGSPAVASLQTSNPGMHTSIASSQAALHHPQLQHQQESPAHPSLLQPCDSAAGTTASSGTLQMAQPTQAYGALLHPERPAASVTLRPVLVPEDQWPQHGGLHDSPAQERSGMQAGPSSHQQPEQQAQGQELNVQEHRPLGAQTGERGRELHQNLESEAAGRDEMLQQGQQGRGRTAMPPPPSQSEFPELDVYEQQASGCRCCNGTEAACSLSAQRILVLCDMAITRF
eukprot:351583-Chlamydomonas_euryale.AAC.2